MKNVKNIAQRSVLLPLLFVLAFALVFFTREQGAAPLSEPITESSGSNCPYRERAMHEQLRSYREKMKFTNSPAENVKTNAGTSINAVAVSMRKESDASIVSSLPPGPSATLVADINQTGGGSFPEDFVDVNGTLFFTGFDGDIYYGLYRGRGLWRSDGTRDGTELVRAFGSVVEPQTYPHNLVGLGGVLYFEDASDNGGGLWRSDGTESGTVRIAWFAGGIEGLARVGNALFFFVPLNPGSGNPGGWQLWRSDGTSSGTILLGQIRTGTIPDRSEITDANGTAYFSFVDRYAQELWCSDGSPAGTRLVKSFSRNINYSDFVGVFHLASIGSAVYFDGVDRDHQTELWRSDGTEAGTYMVADIAPGADSSAPRNLTVMNGVLYFSALDDSHGVELWRSDGTAAGTMMVADINPAPYSRSEPAFLTPASGELYFSADDGFHGRELWHSDGTSRGTKLVRDINPLGSSTPQNLIAVTSPGSSNTTLYFTTDDGVHGRELWKTESTGATMLVKDIAPGPRSAITLDQSPMPGVNLGTSRGRVFFAADDGDEGIELWGSDGTVQGTELVRRLNPDTGDAQPYSMTAVNGLVFFGVFDGHRPGLWRSDGTAEGTFLVKNLIVYPYFSFWNVGGFLFFYAKDGVHGYELWRSDGTSAGTRMIADLNPGHESSGPDIAPVVANGSLYFMANDGFNGRSLWRSDGTRAGTVLIKQAQGVRQLAAVHDTVFFSDSTELWKTDGTTQGTILVAQGLNYPWELTGVGNYLFFVNDDSLWKSDGTASGTLPVSSAMHQPRTLANVNGTLFFVASYAPTDSEELWKSDGTAAGTALLKRWDPSNYQVINTRCVSFDGAAFFTASSPEHKSELWRSDGTQAGTIMVRALNPAPRDGHGSPGDQLTPVGDTLYFTADDGIHGQEPWCSDGTTEGTFMIRDIATGPANSIIQLWPLANIGGTVLFSAFDFEHGIELWKLTR